MVLTEVRDITAWYNLFVIRCYRSYENDVPLFSDGIMKKMGLLRNVYQFCNSYRNCYVIIDYPSLSYSVVLVDLITIFIIFYLM